MATLFDGGLLASFGSVFTFLFVYVLIYALLTKVHLFGDKTEGLNALIALCIAVFTMFSPMVISMITYMTPWLVVLLVVGFMIYIFSENMGMKIDRSKGGPGESILIIIIIICVIVFLIAFAKYYNPDTPGQSSAQVVYTSETITVTDENGSLVQVEKQVEVDNRPEWMKILFSTKVLGFILILLIGGFTIKNLGPVVERK